MLVVVGAATMAAFVFFSRPGRRQNQWLALFLFLEACVFLLLSVTQLVTTSQTFAFAAFATGYAVWPWVMFTYALFLSTLDTPLVVPLRWIWVRGLLAAAAAAASTVALTRTDLWFSGFIRPWFGGLGTGATPLNQTLFAVALLISLFALAAAVSALLRAPTGTLARTQARSFAWAFGFRDAGFIVFAIVVLGTGSAQGVTEGRNGGYVQAIVFPISIFAFHILLALGILRTQLFDIDLRIKFAIEKSAIAAAFAVAFLVASELVERLVGVEGLWFGVGAAVLIGLFFRRVERLAESVGDRLMPGVKDTEDYRTVRKADVFRAAVESALVDGEITPRERRMLAAMADQLGLSSAQAMAIERQSAVSATV